MIYTDSQLKDKIERMIDSFENEVVEFKEARSNYIHLMTSENIFQHLVMKRICEDYRKAG